MKLRKKRARWRLQNFQLQPFQISSCEWKLFLSRIYLDEFKVKKLSKAECALQNLLFKKSPDSYAPTIFTDHEDTDDGVIVQGVCQIWYPEFPDFSLTFF